MEVHWKSVWSILLILGLVSYVKSQTKVTQAEDGQSGTISFSTPDLNDEDAHSPWMPSQLKCDACRIIALQLHERFEKYNSYHKSQKYEMPESELLDITEQTCEHETYSGYGIMEWNGVKRLKGKGLETEDVPGVMQGGGKWPSRLQDMCDQFMGDVGEAAIYKAYKKSPKSRKNLEDYLCRGKGLRGECVRVEAEQAKVQAEKDAKEKEQKEKEKEERRKQGIFDDDDDEDDDDDDDDRDEL